MQPFLKTLATLTALLIAWRVGQLHSAGLANHKTGADGANRGRIESTPASGALHGMAIQLHGGADVYEKYHRLIPEVAALGANTVLFVVHGWQEHAGSLDLRIDVKKTADAKELGRLCDLAKSHGLRVILMPVVLLDAPRNNEWRGKIIPAGHDWDAWFKRYNTFIQHFARVAERHRVDVLMVGSELIKTETYTERWKRIIEEVRQNYRGRLGYSANWDHYQTSKIGFWGELDYVGMTTYYELARGPNPDAAEVDRNWETVKKEILAFQREVDRPILFTEVGWCSQEGAAHEGWNYYANQKATTAGHAEQELLYEAFIRAWGQEPSIGGIIWWEWDPTTGGADDYNYTPRGKPAERVLRRFFTERRAAGLADRSARPESTDAPSRTNQ